MCTKMEQPFYPDSFLAGYGHDYKALKSGMALNLSADSFRGLKAQLPPHLRAQDDGPAAGYFAASLQQQQQQQAAAAAESGSASLKLAAPELERLIVQNSHGVITTTPTPPGGHYYYHPRGATEEQEGFADGFVKALDDLHKMNHMPPPNVSLGGAGAAPSAGGGGYGGASSSSSLAQEPPPVYTNLTSYSPAGFPSANLSYLPQPPPLALPPPARGFKEEPQTVPDLQSPPVSPINMEDQERIKVERKRLRNRLAATKCRKRKLERIARLEDKVKSLKSENAGLSSTASALRDQVAQLKQKVMNHVNNGCQLLLTAKMQQAF